MANKKQKLDKETIKSIEDARIVVNDFGECLEKVSQVYNLIREDFWRLYGALHNEKEREKIEVIMKNKNSRLYNRISPFHWDKILLPYDKKIIETALNILIKLSQSEKEKEHYKTGLVYLESFIDFRELGDELEDDFTDDKKI